ncbi:MAG: hypothetical protein AAF561_00750 [Planctomycetota bacterium]
MFTIIAKANADAVQEADLFSLLCPLLPWVIFMAFACYLVVPALRKQRDRVDEAIAQNNQMIDLLMRIERHLDSRTEPDNSSAIKGPALEAEVLDKDG